MKSNPLANQAIFAAISLLLIGGNQMFASELPREEVRRLVWQQTNPGDVQGWNARQHELQTRPDIKPDLFALVQEAYDKEDWERLGPPLLALRLRSDLSPEELSRLVNPLSANEGRTGPLDMMTRSFVCGALPVLRHYPSDKHEKLVLSFLARNDSLIQENAINTLAEIGTGKSLPALRELSEKFRPLPGNKSRYYDATIKAVAQIEDRIKNKVLQPADLPSAQPLTGAIINEKQPNANTLDHEEKGITVWPVGMVVILAATGLMYLLLKKRK